MAIRIPDGSVFGGLLYGDEIGPSDKNCSDEQSRDELS
jgi:hypothetical protein